jgi:hypothetical protein
VTHGLHQLQFEDHLVSDALHFHEAGTRCRKHMVQVTEPRDQCLGQRLGVAAPDRAIKQHFQQLVVRHGIGAAVGEALAKPLTMRVAVKLRPFGRAARGLRRHGQAGESGGNFVKGECGLLWHDANLRAKRLTNGYRLCTSIAPRGRVSPRSGGTCPQATA